jgi:putative ABC transport system substrate-binding protein
MPLDRIPAAALIVTLALGVLAPLAAEAQQAGKVYRIGYFQTVSRAQNEHMLNALEEGLRERGYVPGRNLIIEYRFADGKPERLPELAAELVRLKVDVIVTAQNVATVAAKQATTTIPIVTALAGDPVGAGLAASLARPGGNVTGLTLDVTPEIAGKRLQLMKEFVPRVSRVAVLWNPDFRGFQPEPSFQVLEDAARQLRMTLRMVEVREAGDFKRAFDSMISERTDGLYVIADPLIFTHRRQIADLAVKNRLPAIFGVSELVEAGGLMSYGVDLRDLYRRAATYIDKILKGAKAGDLPIEQPTKFELVLNLKTAKALGLTIPLPVLRRADRVIE